MAAAVVAAGTAAATAGVEARGAAVAAARPRLKLPARGGEDLRTLGWKVCPPRIFTMVGLEKERRWRGGLQTGNRDLKLKG